MYCALSLDARKLLAEAMERLNSTGNNSVLALQFQQIALHTGFSNDPLKQSAHVSILTVLTSCVPELCHTSKLYHFTLLT